MPPAVYLTPHLGAMNPASNAAPHLSAIQLRNQLPKGLPESDEVGEEDDALVIGQRAPVVLFKGSVRFRSIW